MHLKSLLLVAFSAVAVCAEIGSLELSVLAVLKTAIPAESLSRAFEDPQAFSADLVSSLSAGATPPWYQALPTDVKNALPKLYPVATAVDVAAYATSIPTSTLAPVSSTAVLTTEASIITSSASIITSSASVITTAASVITTAASVITTAAPISGTTAISGNSTVISQVSSATLKTTDGPDTVSTAGAPRMTAAIGAGIAGAFGLVGLFL